MYQGLLINDDQHVQLNSNVNFNNQLNNIVLTHTAQHEVLSTKLISSRNYSLYIINTDEMTNEHINLCKKIRLLTDAPIVIISKKFNYQMMKEAAECHVNDVISGDTTLEDIIKSLQAIITTISFKSYNYNFKSIALNKPNAECVIEQIKLLIDSELHKQITLKQISKDLHFNYAYLGQKFKHKLNISFNEYLLQQRMEKAKQLLLNTDFKIYEVAHQVGYTEIDWFYKKFKEYTGVSANEYRKQLDYSYAN